MSVSAEQVRGVDLPPQGVRLVLVAEFARLLRQGGLRTGLWVTSAVALGAGLLAVAILAYLSSREPDTDSLTVTLPVELTTAMVAVLLSAAVVLHVGRSAQTGATATWLVLVPDRARLFCAQSLATAGLALAVAALCSTIVAIVAMAVSGTANGLGVAALGVLAGSLAAALLAVLAYFIATLVNRATAGILVYVGWWIILPLVFTIATPLAPKAVAPVLTAAGAAVPTALLANATTVSTLTQLGTAPMLRGLGGLVLWAVAFGLVANAVFRRRSL